MFSEKFSEKYVNATGETLTQRFARIQEEANNEIQFKEPNRTQTWLKGSINSKKFKKMELNLKRHHEEIVREQEIKKRKIQAQCVQVEVSELPPDWIEEGVEKIRSIASAYGPGAEECVELCFRKKDTNNFVVIFKESRFAYELYNGLNGRHLDDTEIVVSVPCPRTY